MRNRLLELLYPPKCVFCGALMEEDAPACPDCLEKLPVTGPARRIWTGQWFSQCVSPFFFEGAVRETVHRFKFRYQESCGTALGLWMVGSVRSVWTEPFDRITWVPVSRQRRWERGFDQGKTLAREVARGLGTRPVGTLKKLRNIQPLSRTEGGAPERRRLVRDIYGLTRAGENLAGKRVLLVDDVITTGATLEEASRTLVRAGAAEVCCVTAARTRVLD